MKTLKIAPKVHEELKVFVARNNEENMSDFAGFAIMRLLAEHGHKFSTRPKKQQPDPKTKISHKIKSSSRKS